MHKGLLGTGTGTKRIRRKVIAEGTYWEMAHQHMHWQMMMRPICTTKSPYAGQHAMFHVGKYTSGLKTKWENP